MRFASLEHFGLSAWRLGCVGLAGASVAWAAAGYALGGVLGQGKPLVLLILSALVFYLVVSFPKRLVDRQRVAEARGAVLLSTYAKACLEVTGSRPRTLMMLAPREPPLARAVGAASRAVLLGTDVRGSLARASDELVSVSAAATLRGLATLRPDALDSGDEESQGLELSRELSMETRVPMFMTVCFFAPIMILLYAVFSHAYGAADLSELTALEFIVIDLVYYLCAADRGQK